MTTCNKQVMPTCNKQVMPTCNKQVIPTCNKLLSTDTNDANMQFCVSLPTTYQFFRIGELAGQPGVPVEPVVLSYIDPIMSLADDQVCLSWSSTTGEVYQVEATSDISVGNWSVLETLESNGNSLTHCIDLPAEHAFYRIAGWARGTERG